mgnify:CR=1 FL=1
MTIYVMMAEGFEEIEAVTIVDILRRAELDAKTVSISGNKEVTGAHGVTLHADILFDVELLKEGDMVVLPGGMPGTENLEAHPGLTSLLRYYAEEGKWIAAICAAPMVLGRMGLLKGKAATCYPGFEEYLAGAECRTERVVQEGKFITSRGPGTAMEFSLKLVEVAVGRELANTIREGTLL